MMRLDLVFGVLDALGNFDFLLARQQRHLAHLLEVHADRVVQDVQPGLVLLFLRLRLLDPVHLGLVNDLDFEIAELDVDLVQVLRGDDSFREGVVDIAVGQVTLLLGQADQFLDFEREFGGRILFGEIPEMAAAILPLSGVWSGPAFPRQHRGRL